MCDYIRFGWRGDDPIEIHINGEPQEIAAFVLEVQRRQGTEVLIRCPDLLGNRNANDLIKEYRERGERK